MSGRRVVHDRGRATLPNGADRPVAETARTCMARRDVALTRVDWLSQNSSQNLHPKPAYNGSSARVPDW